MDFYQNQWGAENRLMYEFEKFGFKISNPCLRLRTIHVHDSNFRPGQHAARLNGDGKNSACCPSREFFDSCDSCSCVNCGGLERSELVEKTKKLQNQFLVPNFVHGRRVPDHWNWRTFDDL